MPTYRYRPAALRGDYLRGGTGLALTGIPLITIEAGLIGTIVLGGLAALFLIFVTRTALRHRTKVTVGPDAIALDGLTSKTIEWRNLASVGLSYYTTRRDGSAGWMQLKLADGRVTLRLESTLEGFAAVIERVAREATARGIELAPGTRNNMRALGVAISETDTG